MDTAHVFYLLGLITGGVAGFMVCLSIVVWKNHRLPKPVVLDDYTESLRALDRHPSRIIP